MKRKRLMIAIFTAALIGGSASLWAHEECDEPEASNHAVSQPAQNKSSQSSAAPQVTVKLFQYQPGRLQVKAGTTVTWVNDDEIFHTVTVDSKDKSFDAPLDGKGKSFSFTLSKPGIYSYFCDRHEHMRGEIEVR
jgi:plastocyanin